MVGVIFYIYEWWNEKKNFPKLSICWSDLLVSFSLQTYQFQETNHSIHTHIFHDINNNSTNQQHQIQSKKEKLPNNRKPQNIRNIRNWSHVIPNIQKLYYPNVTENRIYIILRDTF